MQGYPQAVPGPYVDVIANLAKRHDLQEVPIVVHEGHPHQGAVTADAFVEQVVMASLT